MKGVSYTQTSLVKVVGCAEAGGVGPGGADERDLPLPKLGRYPRTFFMLMPPLPPLPPPPPPPATLSLPWRRRESALLVLRTEQIAPSGQSAEMTFSLCLFVSSVLFFQQGHASGTKD